MIKNLPPMQETIVQSLGQEDLGKGMAIDSNIIAWIIPRQKKLVGYSPLDHKELDTIEWLTLSLVSPLDLYQTLLGFEPFGCSPKLFLINVLDSWEYSLKLARIPFLPHLTSATSQVLLFSRKCLHWDSFIHCCLKCFNKFLKNISWAQDLKSSDVENSPKSSLATLQINFKYSLNILEKCKMCHQMFFFWKKKKEWTKIYLEFLSKRMLMEKIKIKEWKDMAQLYSQIWNPVNKACYLPDLNCNC